MPYLLVAQGDAGTLQQLGGYQDRFPENSEGMLELELSSPMAADVIGWMAEKLKAIGVPASSVRTEGRFVRIGFKTELAPLMLIAAAVAGTIIVMGIILAWKLYRTDVGKVASTWFIWVALIIGGIILAVWAAKKYGGRLAGG